MILSAVFLPKDGFKAMILALCAHICVSAIESRHFRWSKVFNFKDFFLSLIPIIAIVVIVAVLRNFLKKDFMETVTQVATGVLLALIIFEFTYHVRKHDDNGIHSIKHLNMPAAPKAVCKLSWLLCRILIVVGVVVTVLTNDNFAAIIVAACLIWIFFELFVRYCWYKYYEHSDGAQESSSNESNVNSAGGGTISNKKVESLVRDIADRWTGREDASLPGAGLIEFNVSVEVSENRIDYTLGGKYECVRGDELSRARIYTDSILQKTGDKIIAETKKELSKYNLPYSNYDVSVRKGYVQE